MPDVTRSDRKRQAASLASEQKFLEALERLGCTPAYDEWLGSHHGHAVICPAGHTAMPAPNNILHGRGACMECYLGGKGAAELARPASLAAADRFRDTLADLGFTLVDTEWRGVNTQYEAACPNGHSCWPYANHVLEGIGPCRECHYDRLRAGAAGRSESAEQEFIRMLDEAGATPAYATWHGSLAAHDVICADGHPCRPRHANLRSGYGVCAACSGRTWNAFYVVASDDEVKFGITSGDPRPRLADHARDGLTDVWRLETGLPDGTARETENAIRAALEEAGEVPTRGREYFRAECLAFVLEIADGWLTAA